MEKLFYEKCLIRESQPANDERTICSFVVWYSSKLTWIFLAKISFEFVEKIAPSMDHRRSSFQWDADEK